MMIFAKVKEEKVDFLFSAEEPEPFEHIFGNDSIYVEITGKSGVPHLGLGFKEGKFQPSNDYKWSDEQNNWILEDK